MEVIAFAVAASAWAGWIWPLVQFLIGLGLVVFFHELGHFLVAKAVKIKVEKFALGFGPKVLGVTVGETEYSLRLLPLGGYVKMLGQEDVPSLHKDEPLDPRSYNAKSVGARLAVVSAGVVMNVIFALVVFVCLAMVGREYSAPVIGSVKKHYPAATCKITWQKGPATQPAGSQLATSVGLKPGDRPVRIDADGVILSILGNDVPHFQRLAVLSTIADPDDKFTLTFERDVDGNTWVGTTELGVRPVADPRFGGNRLSFGLAQANSTTVAHSLDFTTDEAIDPFQDGDELLTVAGRPLKHAWELSGLLADTAGATVPVTVLRKGKEVQRTAPRILQSKTNVVYLADGTKLNADDYQIGQDDKERITFRPWAGGSGVQEHMDANWPREEVTFAQADEILDLLGMVPRLRVTGIVEGGAAVDAKLQAGDVIVHYGDKPAPTIRQLREVSDKVGEAAKATQIAVLRGGRRVDGIAIKPAWDRKQKGAFIGVCRHVDLGRPVVAHVRVGSPVDRANRDANTPNPIATGCVIEKVNDRAVASWLDVYDALKALQGRDVTLTFRLNEKDPTTHTLALGALDTNAFDPDDYELSVFPGPHVGLHAPAQVTLRQDTFGGAVSWALRETCGHIVTTYASLRSLIKGTVSTKGVMGPVGLGAIAVDAARTDIKHLVWLMGYLSAILAVMNFLPLPVVDGGHAVFLILEKIRGKPLSVRVMNAIQISGLVLILLLFVAITFQDIMRFF